MSFKKPINHHPRLEVNQLGLTRREIMKAPYLLCALVVVMILSVHVLLRLVFS